MTASQSTIPARIDSGLKGKSETKHYAKPGLSLIKLMDA